MPRTNRDGKDIRFTLEWLCRRHLSEADLAAALNVSESTYNRRKVAEDFPSFEELEQFANTYNLCAKALQISFGLRGEEELGLLDEEGLRQYIEQGGGELHFFRQRGRGTTKMARIPEPRIAASPRIRRRRLHNAPPG